MLSASRDLDAVIAETVWGYKIEWSRTGEDPFIPELGFKPCPKYSSSMAAAWLVADQLWKGHGAYTTIQRGTAITVRIKAPNRNRVEAFHRKAPLALCAAVLQLFDT